MLFSKKNTNKSLFLQTPSLLINSAPILKCSIHIQRYGRQMRALWGVITVRSTDVKSTDFRSTANIYGAFSSLLRPTATFCINAVHYNPSSSCLTANPPLSVHYKPPSKWALYAFATSPPWFHSRLESISSDIYLMTQCQKLILKRNFSYP